jgi:uncharacterized membrane protein YkvA (DUF1232 family)
MPKGLRIALAVVVGGVALVYDVSPVDLISELFTGPFGYFDDGGVTAVAILGIWKLLRVKRKQKTTVRDVETVKPV